MQTDVREQTGREAKRERTRIRMETAAIELALQYGSENITVDQICALSEVSARTFFNYFGSREAALLGTGKPVPTPEAITQYIEGNEPVFEGFIQMLMDAALSREPDLRLIRLRRELFFREPALASQSFARGIATRDEYVKIIRERIRREQPTASDAEVEDEATVVVATALGVVQVVANRWIESDGTADPAHLIPQAIERLRRLI
ncbi:TetR/AcrR family transcriptional regulator [Demequina sp.]|uniref:TetR/AcrR family transcriptional regulator n=1 Tax=Demequina sp. TaxID=2050685 RepID=UPI003D0EA908